MIGIEGQCLGREKRVTIYRSHRVERNGDAIRFLSNLTAKELSMFKKIACF